jgi:tRNA A-37 threonylcarbamoyl transferase component Bud32
MALNMDVKGDATTDEEEAPLNPEELAREAAEAGDVVPDLLPQDEIKARDPPSPKTPKERKRSNSRSKERSKSSSKRPVEKAQTPKGMPKSPSFKIGALSTPKFHKLEDEDKVAIELPERLEKQEETEEKPGRPPDKLEKPEQKNHHTRGFSTIEDPPASFHPPPSVLGGQDEKTAKESTQQTRHARSGSATVIQRAFRSHVSRRQRAFTNTNMEEKEALQFSQSFQAIQDIRSRALKWEDLKDMKQLTRGMFGEVHTAMYQGYPVIVKTLKPMKPPKDAPKKSIKKMQEEEQLAISDFKKEMSMLTKLWHRKIVHLIGVGVKPKLFMVMEFMEGGSLKDVLAEARRLKQPMDRSVVYDYALDCAHGMRYLHEAFPRILHRDLKPANLLISKAPLPPGAEKAKKKSKGATDTPTERPELKIADFGLSRVLGPIKKHSTERYRLTGGTGSLRYMAPEVAANQPYNEKADVYGFGIILWEMLANDLPYKKLHTHNFYREVVKKKVRPPTDPTWPPDVVKLIEDCWAHDPDARPTFRAVIQRLQHIKETTDFFAGEREKTPSGCCVIS